MTPRRAPAVLMLLGASGLMASLACSSGGMAAGLEPPASATSVAVSAAPANITVGEVAYLRAHGAAASGAPVAVAVTWSATGGLITAVSDSEARFSAAAQGDYWISARASAEPNPVDSVLVSVSAPLSPVVSIMVTPDSVSLLPGAGSTFSVSATRQDGSTFVPAVSWSATGGSISSAGVFSAGSQSGNFRVIASMAGGSLADTAAVVIDGGGAIDPSYTNEPPGLVTPYTITAPQPNPFDVLPRFWNANDGRPRYTLDDYGWSIESGSGEPGDPTRWSIVSDSERGNVLNLVLKAGDPGGYSPVGYAVAGGGHSKGLSWAPDGAPFEVRRVFIAYWVKLSPNWSDPNVEMKHLYFFNTYTAHTASDGNWYLSLSSRARPYLHARIVVQHPGVSSFELDGGSTTRGQWHKVEMYGVLNDVGQSNGSVKIWIDGVLAANWTGLMLANRTPNVDWLKFGVITGGGSSPVPADAYVRFDDWYVKVGP